MSRYNYERHNMYRSKGVICLPCMPSAYIFRNVEAFKICYFLRALAMEHTLVCDSWGSLTTGVSSHTSLDAVLRLVRVGLPYFHMRSLALFFTEPEMLNDRLKSLVTLWYIMCLASVSAVASGQGLFKRKRLFFFLKKLGKPLLPYAVHSNQTRK